jgi:DNA-binding PadR family transcriptional regulator
MSDIARLIPRLSTTERLILDLLREGELFGLQLVDRSDGALKRGTVYVTLGRMQDKGYVESRTEPLPAGAIGLPRRWYRPTEYGLRVHNAWSMAARSFAAQTATPEIRTGAA